MNLYLPRKHTFTLFSQLSLMFCFFCVIILSHLTKPFDHLKDAMVVCDALDNRYEYDPLLSRKCELLPRVYVRRVPRNCFVNGRSWYNLNFNEVTGGNNANISIRDVAVSNEGKGVLTMDSLLGNDDAVSPK